MSDPSDEDRIEVVIADMADAAKGWTIEEFASRAVGLLIMDKGNLNGYQRTLELVLRVHRRAIEADGFQNRVAAAHPALFHDDPTDIAERRDRFGEEANETQQALGQTREGAHQLVDYTYDRPAGDPAKEIGAAALMLASLCVVGGWNMMACAEADLIKLQQPETIARIRAKRATRHGRGPLPGLSPVAEADGTKPS